LIWSLKNPSAFARLGITPSKGVLLFGPPGTGKTLLAKAVASSSSSNFLPVLVPEILKGEVGETEKAIERLFQTAKKAAPCVVFMDEIEALFSSKESENRLTQQMVSQLMMEIDDLGSFEEPSKMVVVLAATNVPWVIDPGLLRPGSHFFP